MRLFIAINFSNEVKDYLSEVQSIVRDNAVKGRYTTYDNFHLTLRFLGEFSSGDVDSFTDILDELSDTIKTFSIKIGDIHSFNRNGKHIVYIDVINNRHKLIELEKKLNQLIDLNFTIKKDYQFKPHITIAREVVFKDNNESINIHPYQKEMVVNQVSLMLSSRNKNNILTYTRLHTVNLIK